MLFTSTEFPFSAAILCGQPHVTVAVCDFGMNRSFYLNFTMNTSICYMCKETKLIAVMAEGQVTLEGEIGSGEVVCPYFVCDTTTAISSSFSTLMLIDIFFVRAL